MDTKLIPKPKGFGSVLREAIKQKYLNSLPLARSTGKRRGRIVFTIDGKQGVCVLARKNDADPFYAKYDGRVRRFVEVKK